MQTDAAEAFARGKDALLSYYRNVGIELGIGMPPLDAFKSMFSRLAVRSGGRQFPNHTSKRAIGLASIS